MLRLLRDLSRETGVGEEIELIAAPANPKDLFSLLRPVETREENVARRGEMLSVD